MIGEVAAARLPRLAGQARETAKAQLNPPIEPYAQGLMEASGGHRVYWQECGNPAAKPALVLHGGPDSRAAPGWRRRQPRGRGPTASTVNYAESTWNVGAEVAMQAWRARRRAAGSGGCGARRLGR
jgi:hypothetical protein